MRAFNLDKVGNSSINNFKVNEKKGENLNDVIWLNDGEVLSAFHVAVQSIVAEVKRGRRSVNLLRDVNS